MAILMCSIMIIAALGISAAAINQSQSPASSGQSFTVTVYYGDEETIAEGATVSLTRIGGGYAVTKIDGSADDGDGQLNGIVVFDGVNVGRYSINAYRVHDTLGKFVGIQLWGEAISNQMKITESTPTEWQLYLLGGMLLHPGSAPAQQAPSQPAGQPAK